MNELPDELYNFVEGTTDSEVCFALLLSLLLWTNLRRRTLLHVPLGLCSPEQWHMKSVDGELHTDLLTALFCLFATALGLIMAHVSEGAFRTAQLREAQMAIRMEQLECEKERVEYDHSLLHRRVRPLRNQRDRGR